MSNSTLADNWSLQDISSLIRDGLDEETGSTIKVRKEEDSFEYGSIPRSIIQMELLFEFLNDLILRDQVIVDEDFVGSWVGKNPWLDSIYQKGIIRSFPFKENYEKILEIRPAFEEKLCVTTDLSDAHNANVEAWDEGKAVPNSYLSQVLWGGAGMLSRGFVYEHSYTPHPLRKQLFVETGVYQDRFSALTRVGSFVESKRAAVKHSTYRDSSVSTLSLSIQPTVTKVIRESSSISDLMSVAMSIRDEYSELRQWIREYQEAINQADRKDIEKYEKLVRSVSQYIDSRNEISNGDSARFTVGFSILKIALKGNPVNDIRNQFGVRSSMCELISTQSWESDLRKLLGFFGHRSSKLGLTVLEHYGGRGG